MVTINSMSRSHLDGRVAGEREAAGPEGHSDRHILQQDVREDPNTHDSLVKLEGHPERLPMVQQSSMTEALAPVSCV